MSLARTQSLAVGIPGTYASRQLRSKAPVAPRAAGVLGRSGNKWEAHSGSTRPGEFCDFDGAQGRAMRALFLDYCNELV